MYYFRFEISTMPDGSTRVSYSPGWHGTMPKCPKDVTVLLYNDKEGYGIARTEDSFVPPEVELLTKEQVIETAKRLAEEGGLTVGYYGMPVILDAAKWAVELDDTGSFVFTHPDVGKPATLTFSDGIYGGQKLKDRWLPEAINEAEATQAEPSLTKAYIQYDDGVIWDMMPITLNEFLEKYPNAEYSEDAENNKKIWRQYLPLVGSIEGSAVSGTKTHEAVAEMPLVIEPTVTEKTVVDSFLKFCPSCHQIVARIVQFEDGSLEVWQSGRCIIRGIKTANLVLTCPALHKVKVVL